MNTTDLGLVVILGGIISAILLINYLIDYLKYLRDKCPRCGRRGWRHRVTQKEIKGTRHTVQQRDSRDYTVVLQVADFEVTYGCRHCDYLRTQKETRRV